MKLLRLLVVPLALVVVGWMRWHGRVRIGQLWSGRLGHLIGNTECYLCERDVGRHAGYLDIWYSRGVSANGVIERRYKRTLHTGPGWLLDVVVRVNRLWVGWERFEVAARQFDRDVDNLWISHAPHIGFSGWDAWRGRRLERKLGIGGKWVCLMVRDGAYLREHGEFGYHDYRDSDVADYRLAVEEVLERGYWVVRMGAKVDRPFHVEHPHYVDYASSGQRSEFGDLWLGANCAFCLGTSTGFTSIPHAFGRPVVYVNHAPLEYSPTFYDKALVIWKHHQKDGKRMTLAEIFGSGAGQFTAAQQFAAAGITLQDNSPEEIRAAVVEQLEGVGSEPQPEFWDAFPLQAISPYNGEPLHGQPRMRIGREFLKGYE